MTIEEITKRELRNLVESKMVKGPLAKQVEEFASIYEKIVVLKNELKRLEDNPKYQESKDKINEMMDELRATGEDTIETKNFVIRMTRAGGTSESVKYTKILEEFLPKVSIKLRSTYDQLKESYTSAVKKSGSFDVKKKDMKESEEFNPLGSAMASLKSAHNMMRGLKSFFS